MCGYPPILKRVDERTLIGNASQMADKHLKTGQIYRFDELTKFAIKLLARQNRKNMQASVAEAIHQAAARLDLAGFVWSDLYDEHPGVMVLKLLAVSTVNKTEEERETVRFLKANREFFYVDERGLIPKRTYVEALWPGFEQYQAHWRRTRDEEPRATRKLMAAALKDAGLPAPKVSA